MRKQHLTKNTHSKCRLNRERKLRNRIKREFREAFIEIRRIMDLDFYCNAQTALPPLNKA